MLGWRSWCQQLPITVQLGSLVSPLPPLHLQAVAPDSWRLQGTICHPSSPPPLVTAVVAAALPSLVPAAMSRIPPSQAWGRQALQQPAAPASQLQQQQQDDMAGVNAAIDDVRGRGLAAEPLTGDEEARDALSKHSVGGSALPGGNLPGPGAALSTAGALAGAAAAGGQAAAEAAVAGVGKVSAAVQQAAGAGGEGSSGRKDRP